MIRIRLTDEETAWLVENLPPPTTKVGFSVMAKLIPEGATIEEPSSMKSKASKRQVPASFG